MKQVGEVGFNKKNGKVVTCFCGTKKYHPLSDLKNGRGKFCSRSCAAKIVKNGRFSKGISRGIRSLEFREKLSIAHTGMKHTQETISKLSGKNNPRWIGDRSKVEDGHHYNTKYKIWMRQVKNRDGWKCKISNGDCSGRLEAHHILSWGDYPELRYELTNGITLCHFHHPRKRIDEKILSPYFQELLKLTN